jgi:hypothetical protein
MRALPFTFEAGVGTWAGSGRGFICGAPTLRAGVPCGTRSARAAAMPPAPGLNGRAHRDFSPVRCCATDCPSLHSVPRRSHRRPAPNPPTSLLAAAAHPATTATVERPQRDVHSTPPQCDATARGPGRVWRWGACGTPRSAEREGQSAAQRRTGEEDLWARPFRPGAEATAAALTSEHRRGASPAGRGRPTEAPPPHPLRPGHHLGRQTQPTTEAQR